MFAALLVAKFQASRVAEPREATFGDPTQHPQSAAVFAPRLRQHRHDTAFFTPDDVLLDATCSVAHREIRLLTRSPTRPRQSRHRVEKRVACSPKRESVAVRVSTAQSGRIVQDQTNSEHFGIRFQRSKLRDEAVRGRSRRAGTGGLRAQWFRRFGSTLFNPEGYEPPTIIRRYNHG